MYINVYVFKGLSRSKVQSNVNPHIGNPVYLYVANTNNGSKNSVQFSFIYIAPNKNNNTEKPTTFR